MTNEVEAKVTTAVLGEKLDHLSKKFDKSVGRWDKHMEDSAEVKICLAVLKSQVDANSKRTQNWDIANSALGMALAGALAYFGLRN